MKVLIKTRTTLAVKGETNFRALFQLKQLRWKVEREAEKAMRR